MDGIGLCAAAAAGAAQVCRLVYLFFIMMRSTVNL